MRKFFTRMIKVSMLLLVTLAFIQAHAQKRLAPLAVGDVQFTIENDVQISDKIYQFDLYLKNTDAANPFEYSLGQAGILISNGILNSGTLSAAIVASSSQMVASEQPTSVAIATGTTNGCIKIASRALPGCGSGTILATTGLGTRFCTIQVTNTVAFAQAHPNLAFQLTTTGVPPFLQTKVYEYQSCVSTQVSTTATNCYSNAINPILNAAPVVVTTAASGITATAAVLNGTINANSVSTVPVFEYGLTVAYGSGPFTGTPSPVTGTTVTPVSYTIAAGLLPSTTYHYHLKGTYGVSSIADGGDLTFTTLTPPPPPPTVVTTAATGISFTTATVNGTVNANTGSTVVTFEYGLTVAYGQFATATPSPVTGSTVTPVSAALSGLASGTLYHYHVVGVNAGGTSPGGDLTFTTVSAVLPSVTTTAATAVTANTATVNGTVNANGTSTNVIFEYGLTPAYGSGLVAGNPTPVTGSTVTAVSLNLTGLTPSTLYHYHCCGTNPAGTACGSDMTFTTPALTLPTVVTTAATNVLPTTATLNGTVNANGASTAVTFQYGLTVAYGTTVAGTPTPVTGSTVTNVSANLTGLAGNTCYHYRVVGVNSSGTANGNDLTFCTPCPPAGQAGPISGPTQVCQGGSGYVYTVTIPNATGYIWTLPVGGTITSGLNTNSITVSYAANALSGYIFVYGTSVCGNGPPAQLGIAMNAPATPSITGPATACINSTGNVYTTQAGMSSYVWTVPAGATIASGAGTNSITVSYTTVGAKTITVNYNNANGCAGLTAASYVCTVNPLPTPTITGPTPACSNYPVVYSTQAGMTGYVWTVSAGGTITGGQGTKDLSVTWTTTGAKTVSVNYVNANGCTAAAATVYNVTVNQGASPTITGPTEVCVNSGYITYTTQAGMTGGYIWAISSGGTIAFGGGTNSVLVTWNTGGAQWISVSYFNSNGCAPPSPTVYNVTVDPAPGAAGTITGTAAICGGSTGIAYSVGAIQGVSTYVWTLPAGATIASGAGTNSITVNFAPNATAGNITVYGNNVCGNGAPSPAFAVAVSPIPGAAGAIDGPSAICVPASAVGYTVADIDGATGYNWTVPTGATIVTGANTSSITVDYDVTAVAGAITVSGTNTCGNGTVSPSLNITVSPTPDIPVISTDGIALTSSSATGNQWYLAGAPITGATAQSYTPSIDGDYYVVVTINGCSAQSETISFFVGIEDLKSSVFSVYPIPNDGRFTVSIVSKSNETFNISIFNTLGMKIFEEGDIVVSGTLNKVIDLKPIAQGVYSIVLQSGQNRIEKKILVNK